LVIFDRSSRVRSENSVGLTGIDPQSPKGCLNGPDLVVAELEIVRLGENLREGVHRPTDIQRAPECQDAHHYPNSDVIYALGYLDLNQDGPIVIEVPPGLQGILDDFWQRPIPSQGEIDGRQWSGDVGLPGPDHGKGGKYLILPPDYKGEIPDGYFTYRSRTYGVFVFWRGFFKDSKQLEEPVRVMEQTRIYPLGKRDAAKAMEFPDASGVSANMLYPPDGTAYDMLARFIEHEYVDPVDAEMRGVAAALGIVKGKPFARDASTRALLDKAARTATSSPTPLQRLSRMLFGIMTDAGSTSFPATPPSPPIRSITLTHAQGFSPMPTRRAPAWRRAWRISARSIQPLLPTQTAITWMARNTTTYICQRTFRWQFFGRSQSMIR
jgi:Protein of unknown function (DUF1254)